MMANTQINVTENGTTTLATAGRYCDRNIDINVNVSGGGVQPTQFTNLYDPVNVVIDKSSSYSSSSGYTVTSDSETNYIRIPYKHAKGEPINIRMRGIGTVRSRLAYITWKENETAVAWGQLSNATSKSYDEYGDIVIAFSPSGSTATSEWDMLEFNFQYPGFSSASEALTGPIITINEPIGNGGHV